MSTLDENTGVPQEAFDALHPFSFLTDEYGTILFLGRSLRKLTNGYEIINRPFQKCFSLVQPIMGIAKIEPECLIGELVVISFDSVKAVMLRGQVVRIVEEPALFIFSLRPVITSPEQVSALGVEYADFELGAPIFDFLLILHAQRLAQAKLEKANELLRLDARMSRLLQRITTEAYRAKEQEVLFRSSTTAVCQELGWSIGHVFFVDTAAATRLISSNIWYLADPERLAEFVRVTESLSWDTDREFPSFTLHTSVPVWIAEYGRNGDNVRAQALPHSSQSTAVSVPIAVGGCCVALIEFISEQPQHFLETAYSFFTLLGSQLGYALAYLEGEQKERDRLAALAYASKMSTLGEIAAGVAHEISNPISTISLVAQILKRAARYDGDAPAVIASQVPKIEMCVERVAKIVAELRDFSRESSKDPFEAASLRKIIMETMDLCQARFVAQGIKLELPSDIPDWAVYCRPSQISQVILNLLNNSYDAVVGQVERWVRLECKECEGFYEIAVSDSGAGIAEDIREKIMQPFFTTKPPGRGTGLGLSISSNIVTDHGGCLGLDTTAPHTRFVLALPKVTTPQTSLTN